MTLVTQIYHSIGYVKKPKGLVSFAFSATNQRISQEVYRHVTVQVIRLHLLHNIKFQEYVL